LVYYIKGNSVRYIFKYEKYYSRIRISAVGKNYSKRSAPVSQLTPAVAPEDTAAGLEPHALVRQISLDKANAVAAKHPDSIIIAADTIGVIGAKILGKPHTAQGSR